MVLIEQTTLEDKVVKLDRAKIKLPEEVTLNFSGSEGFNTIYLLGFQIYYSESKREARDYYQRASKAIEEGMYELKFSNYGTLRLIFND